MSELQELLLPWAVLVLISGMSLFLAEGRWKIVMGSMLQGVLGLALFVIGIFFMALMSRLIFGNSLEAASLFYGLFMVVMFFNGWIVLFIGLVLACWRFYQKGKLRN